LKENRHTLWTVLIPVYFCLKQKLSYLAIALNRSHVSCTHNTLRVSIITPWPWNLG